MTRTVFFFRLALPAFIVLTITLIVLSAAVSPALAMSPGSRGPALLPQSEPAPSSPLTQMFIEVIGLSAFLFAAVAWLKQLGVEGKNLTISSLIGGMIIGFLVRYATAPPVTIQEWIWAFLYGLLCGFVASGAYKGGQSMTGTDDKSLTITNAAQAKQTAKIVAAVDAESKKQLPQ